jgi:uncharacterized protein (DUF305 family)
MRCAAHGMDACERCYAHGGDSGATPGGTHDVFDHSKKDHRGTSVAGNHVRGANMAKEAGQHRAHHSRMESAKALHREASAKIKAQGVRNVYAEGGDVVDRIMAKRGGHDSMGNDDVPMADDMSADYDYLDQMPEHHEADYTGADSGDMDGGDPDEGDDMVSRIMRKRRQHNPVPA